MQLAHFLGCGQHYRCAQLCMCRAGVVRVVPAPETTESSSSRGQQAPEATSGGTLPLGARLTAPPPHPPALGLLLPGRCEGCSRMRREGTASLQLGLGRGAISRMVMMLRYHLW